ncbi:hypothetical protein N7528_001138 [Penicillium herquei]|nr:hypothetical protein N7528_001138 [Penicillium herquei]
MVEQQSKLIIERVSEPVHSSIPHTTHSESHPSPSGSHAVVSLPKELQTRTAKELAALTPTEALRALQRLHDGYSDPISKAGYPPAITNEAGCILVQKAPNRTVS